MDTTDSEIKFDDDGVCDHCRNFYDNIQPNWHTDERGASELKEIIDKIKEDGKNKEHDCLIGISGGVDSSYLTYSAVEKWGLRPLIISCDVGWNLNVAVDNIERIVRALKLDLVTEVVNWEEMKDLQTAYFKSQVPYQDTPQDHAIFAAVYNFAAKNKFKYVLTGGNFSTECVREPNEWVHLNDIAQIKDIHKKFGKVPLKTLPLCGMFKYRLYYRYIKGMKIIKPLDLIPYHKESAIKELEDRFGWIRYKNKHYENTFTRFYEGYWLIKKYGFDKRKAHYSSLILTGQMTRDDALEILSTPPYPEKDALDDMEFVCKKLEIPVDEFVELMNGPKKSYKDYKSDKPLIDAAIKFAQLIGMEKRNFR
jgi:N-acetyl sugar amidotransferase